MSLYLKTQESSDEIGRIISGLVRRIKNIRVLESEKVEGRVGKCVASIGIGEDIIDIVVQDNLTSEARGLLINTIGYERNMNIWFHRVKGESKKSKSYAFPLTKFEREFAEYIGKTFIEEGKAEKATLAVPSDRIKSMTLSENLKGIREDYNFEHF